MADKSLPSIQSRVKIVQIEKRKEEMNMKKFFAILMTLSLMLSLAVPAMAADTNGTVTNRTDRAYKAYQIFKGTQAAKDEVLGDVEWGTGIDYGAFLTALKSSDDFVVESKNIFADCETAADVASALKGITDKSEIAQSFANLAEKHLTTTATDVAAEETVTLASGYYLLVDQTPVDGENKAKNPALLQVTNDDDLHITVKYDTPKVDKTIKDEEEAADACIGDTVTFVLTATMPSTFEGYDTYKVVLHDTMSKGLDFVAITSVKLDGVDVTEYTETHPENEGVTTLTVTFTDVLKLNAEPGDIIVVEYTATVNSGAVIGEEGNPNKVYLEYSNDPDWDGTGDGEPTGKTPEDEVIVFVYELDVTKVDGQDNDKKLADAEFILLNSDQSKIAKVSDGKLVAWVVIGDVTANADGTYPADYTLKSESNGEFAIAGLDAGTYYLRETKAPAGYNKLTADVKIEIVADITDTEDSQSLDALTIAIDDGTPVSGKKTDGDALTGVVETTVENNAGATLPETGGMGTTIFYIVGGVMVVAAVVLLITKKRMSAEG